MHNLIDWDYRPEDGGHRPVTLVFATAKTPDAARQALFARRTVVWWKNTLIGRPAELSALLQASLKVEKSAWSGNTLRVSLRNNSDADFQLRNQSGLVVRRHGPVIEAGPNAMTVLEFRFAERQRRVELQFEVLNALVAPGEPGVIEFDIDTGDPDTR